MKYRTFLTFLLIFGAFASYAQEPELEEIPIDHIYVPKGFDSNDNVEVVVKGYLPNLCYKVPRIDAVRLGNQILIKAFAYKYENKNGCPEMVVNFLETVSLGFLDEGSYSAEAETLLYHTKSNFEVGKPSGPFTDDHIYANVDYVESILDVPTPGWRRVILRGEHPNSCMDFKEVNFVSNDKDTISILPIMKIKNEDCIRGSYPFKKTIILPEVLSGKHILLHVRVMNGKSVNRLFRMD